VHASPPPGSLQQPGLQRRQRPQLPAPGVPRRSDVRPLQEATATQRAYASLPPHCCIGIAVAVIWSGWQPERFQDRAIHAVCVLPLTGCAWSRRYRKSRDKGGCACPPATRSLSMMRRPAHAGNTAPASHWCPPRALNVLCRRRANGSVLNEIAAGNYSAHAGLDICRGKVLDIVPRVRADACPELTYADAIAVLGAHQMLSFDFSTLARALRLVQVHRASQHRANPCMTS